MNQKWWYYVLSVLLIIVSCVVGCVYPYGSPPETYSEPYADPAAGRMMFSPDLGGSGSSHEAPSHTPQPAPRSMPQGSGAR
ncbi:hypothetical protein [Gimesia aquarii]|uniref:Lipoprotein n=1 Tax=Gimesia aquarii TaxID=2527964 RepID=A0A517WPI4_9PLAN|nr:hypothetical protein [Gimesia aquarii]QDU07152.1 hypothetical protein V202x_05020 [Gimesia aquarii]